MIPEDETFDGTWPFAPHYTEAPGFRMHYVDEGRGEPVVLLHGEPTWGYLYRRMIPPLAEHHRVVVPDHMGFGKSATPADREYTLRTHVENLEVLLFDELDLRGVTFFLQDWGGAMGTSVACRHPDRVARLFLANTLPVATTVPEVGERLRQSRWFRWIDAGLADGRTERVLGDLGSNVLSIMRLLGVNAPVDDTWIRAYSAAFPTPADARGGIDFPLDVHLGRFISFAVEHFAHLDTLRSIPAAMAEGLDDHAIPPDLAMEVFADLWPDGPITTLPGVGHFCQEDAPDALVALLRQFIQLTPTG